MNERGQPHKGPTGAQMSQPSSLRGMAGSEANGMIKLRRGTVFSSEEYRRAARRTK